MSRRTYTSHTVRDGETMSSIAGQWFGDVGKWDLIAKANPLVDPSKLQIGQKLRLPAKDTRRAPLAVTVGREAQTYIVRSVDTLSGIAKAHYGDAMKYPEIFEANKPLLKDPDKIYPGQVLRIPALD